VLTLDLMSTPWNRGLGLLAYFISGLCIRLTLSYTLIWHNTSIPGVGGTSSGGGGGGAKGVLYHHVTGTCCSSIGHFRWSTAAPLKRGGAIQTPPHDTLKQRWPSEKNGNCL
jgi:hypothetical protein